MPDVAAVTPTKWRSFWRSNPLEHLAKSKGEERPLFLIDGDRFLPNFQIDERLGETFDVMVGEIVDWRLADYLIDGVEHGGESEPVNTDAATRLDREPDDVNAHLIGERFKRDQVPAMFGLQYNPGNWQSGHVSIGDDAVLFVTLQKTSAMQFGSDYVDHFESRDEFVWASQNSVGPESKKGREILESPGNGVRLHLFARSKKSDVAFEYCGLVEPINHHGAKPMSVTFRLLTPLSEDAERRFVDVTRNV